MFLKHKWTVVLVGAAMLLASPGYAAKEPLRLAPSSKWEVNYKDDSCRLARKFGEGDQQVFLMLDRFRPDDYFKVTLAGKPVRLLNELRQLTIQFGSAEPEQKIPFLIGKMGKDLPAVFVKSKMRIVPATDDVWKPFLTADEAGKQAVNLLVKSRENAVTEISIRAPFLQTVVLETGPLRPALKAFESCTDELLTHWGIDVEKHRTMTRAISPLASPTTWILPEDYPTRMMEQNLRDLAHFRLNVSDTGLPTACSIQESTRQKEFDDAVCAALIKRARFDPALDAAGKPMPSYYLSSVTFQTPD